MFYEIVFSIKLLKILTGYFRGWMGFNIIILYSLEGEINYNI